MSPPKKPTPDTPLFNLEDIVRLTYQKKTDESESGQVVGITYRPGNCVEYLVKWFSFAEETKHYASELQLDDSFDA